MERLAELERRLGLNNAKQWQAPSSDGLERSHRASAVCKNGDQARRPAVRRAIRARPFAGQSHWYHRPLSTGVHCVR